MKHHPTLHNGYLKKHGERRVDIKNESLVPRTAETPVEQATERINFTRKSAKCVYLRILPVTLKGPYCEIDTYALLDGGSTVSLISEQVANQLELKGLVRPLIASWFDDTINVDQKSREVSVEIRGASGKTFLLREARAINMQMPGQSMTVDPKKWPHLKNLEIPKLRNAIPSIMIGEDNVHLKRTLKQVTGRIWTPFATLTPLGWMVHGPECAEGVDKELAFFIKHQDNDQELNDLVRDFWTTESFGVSPTQNQLSSREDQRAREILYRSLKRIDGQWEAGLLWKTDQEVLPESRDNTEKRLLSIERKMTKDSEFGKRYRANIQAYIDKGYARKLSGEKECQVTNRTWYLPHFAAYNSRKPEKLRMVFDAAAKSRGLSLNDRLLKGPDLLNSLPGLLFKFREKKIAICGDLREMFHQVRIKKEDCYSQRFVWRNSGNKKIDTYEMNVMIFGAISSPYVAHEVKNRNAAEFQGLYLEACNAIVKKHYMDDYLDSLDTEEDAIKRIREVMHVHRKEGFDMRNIMTNSQEVRTAINPEYLAPIGKGLTLLDEDYTRVLGVNWTPETDSFFFSTKFPNLDEHLLTNESIPTKRQILKILMSLFDPLGLLAFLTIRAKILMQDIWREGTSWEEKV